MGVIKLENIKVYAYQGVFDVEQLVGQWYDVSVEINYDFTLAAETDELDGTIDYSKINDLVRLEMQTSSKLIEHVAGRIAKKIKDQFPPIESGKVTIKKLTPPVKGSLKCVTIELSF